MNNKCKWCGNEGKYYFKITKTYCCSKYPQQCPEFKKKLSKAKIGKKRSKESIKKQSQKMRGKSAKPKYKKIETQNKCDYGCGKQAKYIFSNGKLCCEKNYRSCESFISSKNINCEHKPKGTLIENQNILCSYGCGKVAKYKFKNGNYCCSEYANQCIKIKRKLTDKQKEHLSIINKKPLSYWYETYPLFAKLETPIQTIGGELLVRCKNENCKKLFVPTYIQLYERIRNIENEDGGSDYFYCSEKCKRECPLFGLKTDPFKKTKKIYTYEEHQQFRIFVLERDNYECQYCGKTAEHVHHERPQKLEPFYALDPDYAWSCCKKCHYEKGHKDECSTGKLANIIC